MREFPTYLTTDKPVKTGLLVKVLGWIIQATIQCFIWIVLRPRIKSPGALTADEVMDVYDREARTYNWKHHMTTRGQDLVSRREAAWVVLNHSRSLQNPGSPTRTISVLDLCTGTGLTVREMVKVAHLWGVAVDIVGLDLNGTMVEIARRNNLDLGHVEFVWGDATRISPDLGNFDLVTQVFGIGGIPEPGKVFRSVLETLVPGGEYFIIDMHRPIFQLPGEFQFFCFWIKSPVLEAMTYQLTTIPLALRRLWGWRDPTMDFYIAPLVTWYTPCTPDEGQWYGFETQWFKQETERWWFGLPVMPTARLLLRKVPITADEARRREVLLQKLIAARPASS